MRLTGRLCRQAARQVASGRSVAAVAAELGVSWPVAHRHYAAYADGLLTEPDPPVVPGLDETRRGTPKWTQDAETGKWVRTERFETSFTDLSGTGRLLGQVAGRTGAAVAGWLDARGQDWKNQVQFVAIDPCAVYRSAITRSLPDAVIVVDHFHLVRLASQAVTKVRQRVTRQALGRRGTARDPAWANRRRLLRGRRVLRLVRPRRRARGHHPGQDHRGLVAADPRLHRHRHHQRVAFTLRLFLSSGFFGFRAAVLASFSWF